MKKIFTKILVAVMILTVAGASACKNRGEAGKQKEINMVELEALEALEQQIEENVYPLPTSAEVIKHLTDMDLGYILGATNPPENVGNYVESYSRSVNMGVYGADLSYATLYNMQQDVIDYLASIRTLTLEQNLAKIYDESLYNEIKVNFDNRDALVTILTDAFDRTYSIMVDAGQANLALLMVGGAWIEGMYLTLAVSESGAHLSGFEPVLLEQKKSFELFEEMASSYSDDPQVARILAAVQPVREIYSDVGTSLIMEDVEALKRAVNTVRAELVK
jgi:hypothetical protein